MTRVLGLVEQSLGVGATAGSSCNTRQQVHVGAGHPAVRAEQAQSKWRLDSELEADIDRRMSDSLERQHPLLTAPFGGLCPRRFRSVLRVLTGLDCSPRKMAPWRGHNGPLWNERCDRSCWLRVSRCAARDERAADERKPSTTLQHLWLHARSHAREAPVFCLDSRLVIFFLTIWAASDITHHGSRSSASYSRFRSMTSSSLSTEHEALPVAGQLACALGSGKSLFCPRFVGFSRPLRRRVSPGRSSRSRSERSQRPPRETRRPSSFVLIDSRRLCPLPGM